MIYDISRILLYHLGLFEACEIHTAWHNRLFVPPTGLQADWELEVFVKSANQLAISLLGYIWVNYDNSPT